MKSKDSSFTELNVFIDMCFKEDRQNTEAKVNNFVPKT